MKAFMMFLLKLAAIWLHLLFTYQRLRHYRVPT